MSCSFTFFFFLFLHLLKYWYYDFPALYTATATTAPRCLKHHFKASKKQVDYRITLYFASVVLRLLLLFWHVSDFITIQAVIQNPFSNGGSPVAETVGAETRFAYFPAATVSDGTATAVSVQATADQTITQAGGKKTFQKWCQQNFSQNNLR